MQEVGRGEDGFERRNLAKMFLVHLVTLNLNTLELVTSVPRGAISRQLPTERGQVGLPSVWLLRNITENGAQHFLGWDLLERTELNEMCCIPRGAESSKGAFRRAAPRLGGNHMLWTLPEIGQGWKFSRILLLGVLALRSRIALDCAGMEAKEDSTDGRKYINPVAKFSPHKWSCIFSTLGLCKTTRWLMNRWKWRVERWWYSCRYVGTGSIMLKWTYRGSVSVCTISPI